MALLYALSIEFSLTYLTIEGGISILWIPSGIGLAAVLIGGKRYSLTIFSGSLAAYLWLGEPLLPATFTALGNTLESLLSYWLLTRLHIKNSIFNPALTHPHDYFMLDAAAAFALLLVAFIEVMILWLVGMISSATISPSLMHWWMSHSLGIVVATPFILVWKKLPTDWLNREHAPEVIACFGLTLLVGYVIFFENFKANFIIAPPYLAFLFITWGAVRFGRHGSLLVTVIITFQALLGAQLGSPFFATNGSENGLYNYWLYTMVLTVVGTSLSLMIYQRQQTESQLNNLLNNIAETNRELNRISEERLTALDAASKALAAEREMAEAQQQFVAVVSHEFRTPLAIIDAANQSLRVLIDPEDVKLSRRIDNIARAIERLNTLIDHTLSRERLAVGRLMAQPVAFGLCAWLAEQARVAQLMAPLHPVTLTLDGGLVNKSMTLSGDSHLLSVAWMNLVDNAAKFSLPNSPIRLGARLDGETLTLDVVDLGIGISASDLPVLFDKFVRGSNVQGIAGVGLGLHMVLCIAKLHDGTVSVVNTNPGCCATLRVNLKVL